jgi:hypothetical protein
MLEARLVLAMAVRRYDFVKVGLGATASRDGDGVPIIDEHEQYVSAEPLYDVSFPGYTSVVVFSS